MKAVERALNEIESGKVEEGLGRLARLEQTADDQEKYAIAEVYHELGHIEKAKSLIEELLALYPEEGSLHVLFAELLIDLDKEDEAIEQLTQIKEEDEAYLQAQLLLADLYQMLSLDEVAEQKLLLAEKKAPEEVIISYGLGVFYLERGDYLKSIPYLKKAVHADEKIPDDQLELHLAEAYSASGQFEDSAHYYRLGLKKHTDPHALFGYGFTAYQLGDYVLAITQLTALKEMDPDFSSLYPLLAKAYEAEERLDEAMETLQAGMAVDEFNEQLYVLAGKMSFKRQNPEEGVSFLREAIALNPANVEAVQTLASYLKHQERYEDVLDLVTHVRSFGEEDHLFTWYEAWALNGQDEYEEAYSRYQAVEHVFESDQDYLEEYGRFLLEYGLRDRALRCFERLYTLYPERLDIKELLYDLHQQENDSF